MDQNILVVLGCLKFLQTYKKTKQKSILSVFFLCAGLMLSVKSQIAVANRGISEQSEPLLSPDQNFQEYFNTSVIPERRFIINIPLGSVIVGMTKNFSLGTNIPLIFYMIDKWTPAFAFSARYRFFSNKKLSSTLTGYAGYGRFIHSNDNIKIYYINATYNNSITINKNQFITTQINALTARYTETKYNNNDFADITRLNAISFAAGYTYILNLKWDVNNTIGIPFLMNLYQENRNFNGNYSFKHIRNFPVFYRLLFAWKITPESLLNFGGFLISQSDIGTMILPWLNWSILF